MRVKGIAAAAGLMAAVSSWGVAQAEVVTSPSKALALMTEARVAGEKCGYLSAAERRELTEYAARVELVAVRRAGAAAARRALLDGRKRGLAGCSEEKRETVLAVLEGARRAARGAPMMTTARPIATKRVAQRRERAQRSRVAAHARRTAARPAARQARPGAVSRYVALASVYYHALKCRNRPQAELMRMWRGVRDMHYRLVRQAGGAVVARAKREAARRGNARACR